ncbi:cupin domain-containing protein [Spirosoma utsteinense]|uniref:cupin domain-containing protein n=1 Tax=Spirosoma utsteinense TaxID=2585773 RepID=UPI001ABD21EE|nr:cupin domain-containing protein [Spirosoma utsteinense]MBC3786990.1 (S)-ureidoglycine aminohydrolase [Spirosoma utsteinense]
MLFWLLTVTVPIAYGQSIASKVYSWSQVPVVRQTGYEERTLLDGTTTDLANLTVQAVTLPANQPAQSSQQLDEETLLIIRTGKLTLTLGEKTKTLGPGSVAVIMPGDAHRLENKSKEPLTYYLMRYTSNDMPDLDLYRLAGGSFWVDWNEVPYTPHDKGGIRRMFDCATVMTKRAEMHVTTLNPGLWSHLPHTHRAAELLFMIENTAHEQIGGVLQRAEAGDLIFLEANVPHAIQNSSQGTCTYIAFQFE